MTDLLRVEGLEVRYGAATAVRGIGLTVPQRGTVGLLGANGAGKSTVLKAIAGLIPKAAGRVLLLDEPAAGLNPAETRQLMAVLRGLVSPELIIVVVEHDMDLIMQLCHRIHVLNFGQRIATGTPEEIRADPEVIRVYLGDSDD